jgi:hypothetical protein
MTLDRLRSIVGGSSDRYGTKTTYADSTRVTAYVDGRRVWGNEP